LPRNIGYLKELDFVEEREDMLLTILALPGMLVVFLAVFYNQHCYARYNVYTEKALSVSRWMVQFAHEIHASQGSNEDITSIVRLMCAANHLVYYQISGKNRYQILKKRFLLSPAEISRVKRFNGDKYSLVMGWVMQILHKRLTENKLHAMAFKGLRDEADKIQDVMGTLFEIEDQPIPFTYYHMLNISSFTYMLLYTAIMGVIKFG
jgi:predicted membrane chloride channel (bestrophin family)